MLMGLTDKDEIFAFTKEGEAELPKNIHHPLIKETMTKAMEIVEKAQEGKQQRPLKR